MGLIFFIIYWQKININIFAYININNLKGVDHNENK